MPLAEEQIIEVDVELGPSMRTALDVLELVVEVVKSCPESPRTADMLTSSQALCEICLSGLNVKPKPKKAKKARPKRKPPKKS